MGESKIITPTEDNVSIIYKKNHHHSIFAPFGVCEQSEKKGISFVHLVRQQTSGCEIEFLLSLGHTPNG